MVAPQVVHEAGAVAKALRALGAAVGLLAGVSKHAVHSYGFSPVCVRMCRLRLLAWLNFRPHWSHWKGCSPECVRR